MPRPAARVEHDAHGVAACAGTHRQLGIVGDRGARPDEHRVAQGAQPVQMEAVLFAGDVVGVTGACGDEAVDALAELGEGEAGTAQAERGVERGEGVRLGRGGRKPAPHVVLAPYEPCPVGLFGRAHAQQLLPCRIGFQSGRGGVPVAVAGYVRVRLRPCGPTRRRHHDSRTRRWSAKAPVSAVSTSSPLRAVASEGLPTTPDSV